MRKFNLFAIKPARRSPRLTFGKAESMEVRLLPAATYLDVVQAANAAILDSANTLLDANQQVVDTKLDLQSMVNDGYQQNARDITNYAVSGNTAGIKQEVGQNKVLAGLSKQINTDCNGVLRSLAKIHRDLVNEVTRILVSAARRRISNDVALERIGLALDAVNTRYMNLEATAESRATDTAMNLAEKLDEYNNSGAADETLEFNGNVAGTLEVAALGVTASFTGTMTIAPFRPVEGAIVVVSLNINEVEVQGQPDVTITSAIGTVVAKYREDGTLEPIVGSLVVAGNADGIPFAVPASISSEQIINVTVDNNQISAVSGEFTIPAVPGIIDDAAVGTYSIAPAP